MMQKLYIYTQELQLEENLERIRHLLKNKIIAIDLQVLVKLSLTRFLMGHSHLSMILVKKI